MESDQWETRFPMIEIRHGDVVPPAGLVTAGAIESELALVFILVAGSAVLKFQVGVLAERRRFSPALIGHQRVAFGTVDCAMFPRQDKPGAVMAETGDRLEMVVGMTCKTISPELAAMLIDMAADTAGVESEECL